MATWDTAQTQARLKFGLGLDDDIGNNITMILADPYGNFIPGPVSGLPQLVTVIVDGIPTLPEDNLANPVDAIGRCVSTTVSSSTWLIRRCRKASLTRMR